MEIKVPGITEQQRFIFEQSTKQSIKLLQQNLKAPVINDLDIDEAQYGTAHLLTEAQGWEPPAPELIYAYLEQLKRHTDMKSDKAIGQWLGLKGGNPDRRVREYKTSAKKIPYDLWRKILVATGRAPQEIIPVIAFMS